MARYKVSYTSYPSSKAATEYSRDRAVTSFYIGGIVIFMALGSVIWYVYGIIDLLGKLDVMNFLQSFAAIAAMSGVALYVFCFWPLITDRECKLIILRENAKKAGADTAEVQQLIDQIKDQYKYTMTEGTKTYYSVFIPGFIAGTGLVGVIKSVYMLCHREDGLVGLIISLVITIGCAVYYICKYGKKANEVVVPDMRNDNMSDIPKTSNGSGDMLFCRKCGNKILSDSRFCSKCGAEVIR